MKNIELDIIAIEKSTGDEFSPTMIDLDNVHQADDGKFVYPCWYQRSQCSGDGMWKWCYIKQVVKK